MSRGKQAGLILALLVGGVVIVAVMMRFRPTADGGGAYLMADMATSQAWWLAVYTPAPCSTRTW